MSDTSGTERAVSRVSKAGAVASPSTLTRSSKAAKSASGVLTRNEKGTVKVVRNGNGRALPVPSGILAAVGATVGSQFEVSAVGEDLLFHPVGAGPIGPAVAGSGKDRVFVPSAVAFAGSAAGVALLDDWNF